MCAAQTAIRQPAVFVAHGGGPLPLLDHPSHRGLTKWLQSFPSLLKSDPKAILVISAHWEVRLIFAAPFYQIAADSAQRLSLACYAVLRTAIMLRKLITVLLTTLLPTLRAILQQVQLPLQLQHWCMLHVRPVACLDICPVSVSCLAWTSKCKSRDEKNVYIHLSTYTCRRSTQQ